MRIPPKTLPQAPARQAIAADEALLDHLGTRLWLASAAAVVVGLGLHHRLATVVDLDRCTRRNIDVIERRAGGGALLLDQHNVLCGAIAVPTPTIPGDVTESYRWLGDALVAALARLRVPARRAEVAEARADVAALRASPDPVARLLLHACYGALSPHEVVVDTKHGPAKLVGLAQIRRRDTALFQFGVLLHDQSALADVLLTDTEADRQELRAALKRRTIGLTSLTPRSAAEAAEAITSALVSPNPAPLASEPPGHSAADPSHP